MSEKTAQDWDAIVIGAGPAGSVAAHEIARAGYSVLLVDKNRFPRQKVCGCCVNERALQLLTQMGFPIGHYVTPGSQLREFHLAHRSKQVKLPLPGGISLARKNLDALLVKEATNRGASFVDGTHAFLEYAHSDWRYVRFESPEGSYYGRAKIVLVGDGIGGDSLRFDSAKPTNVADNSRLGLATILSESPNYYEQGTVYMAIADRGYVGLVRLEDGRLNIAAAVDPSFFQEHVRVFGISQSVRYLLTQAGLPDIPQLEQAVWQGTPPLTRRRGSVAGQRFFVIGDAASFAEPFTGEGIAWAITSAQGASEVALKAIRHWDKGLEKEWNRKYHKLLFRRQWACRALTLSLRKARLTELGVYLLSHKPQWSFPFISWFQGVRV